MADAATPVPVKNEGKAVKPNQALWSPFETLRSEIDRLFDDISPLSWRPLERGLFSRPVTAGWSVAPAVDVVEKADAYEITAEVPGIDEKQLDVKLANGILTISGEKSEEKEDKQKEYHVSERRYGSFQRAFRIPDGVDTTHIEAMFVKGLLTVKLPKSAEAQKSERKVEIKAA